MLKYTLPLIIVPKLDTNPEKNSGQHAKLLYIRPASPKPNAQIYEGTVFIGPAAIPIESKHKGHKGKWRLFTGCSYNFANPLKRSALAGKTLFSLLFRQRPIQGSYSPSGRTYLTTCFRIRVLPQSSKSLPQGCRAGFSRCAQTVKMAHAVLWKVVALPQYGGTLRRAFEANAQTKADGPEIRADHRKHDIEIRVLRVM